MQRWINSTAQYFPATRASPRCLRTARAWNPAQGRQDPGVKEVDILLKSYAVEVSPEFISSVTEAVTEEMGAWQARPLEPMYRWCSLKRLACFRNRV